MLNMYAPLQNKCPILLIKRRDNRTLILKRSVYKHIEILIPK
jgi:hypothetical protein